MTVIFQKNALNISVIFSVVLRVNYKEMMGTEKMEYYPIDLSAILPNFNMQDVQSELKAPWLPEMIFMYIDEGGVQLFQWSDPVLIVDAKKSQVNELLLLLRENVMRCMVASDNAFMVSSFVAKCSSPFWLLDKRSGRSRLEFKLHYSIIYLLKLPVLNSVKHSSTVYPMHVQTAFMMSASMAMLCTSTA